MCIYQIFIFFEGNICGFTFIRHLMILTIVVPLGMLENVSTQKSNHCAGHMISLGDSLWLIQDKPVLSS
jgi:hypothetical protein